MVSTRMRHSLSLHPSAASCRVDFFLQETGYKYTLQLLIMTSVSFTNKNSVFWTLFFFTYRGESLKSLWVQL